MSKTLSVSAIENGVVIDHIPAGQAVRIASFLGLAKQENKVTIGLNLQTNDDGLKDLIKIEGRALSDGESNEIAVFAPHATVNVIKDFKVLSKSKVTPPKAVVDMWLCPNTKCITNRDQIKTHFDLRMRVGEISLQCKYCEKRFSREQVKDISV